jgi:hypothetical protein
VGLVTAGTDELVTQSLSRTISLSTRQIVGATVGSGIGAASSTMLESYVRDNEIRWSDVLLRTAIGLSIGYMLARRAARQSNDTRLTTKTRG